MTRWPAVAALVFLALSSQAPAARAQPAEIEEEGGCPATASASWTPLPGRTYRILAVASGRSCGSANVVLMVGRASGPPLLSFTSAAADLPLVFGDVASRAAMTVALHRWIEQPAGRTVRQLPPWPDAADAPVGEPVFNPEPEVMRDGYMAARKAGLPLFCFVQGSESAACYVLDARGATLSLLGTEMLPG